MNKEEYAIFKKFGSKGGKNTKKLYGLAHFSRIGKLGQKAKKQALALKKKKI